MFLKSVFVGFLTIWMLGTTLSAQTLLNSFPLKKPPLEEGYYFPYEDENGSAYIFLYSTLFDFRVLYLDQDFNLIEDLKLGLEGEAPYTYNIGGFIDKTRTLIIFAQLGSELKYSALVFDKRERSLKRTGLEIPLETYSLHTPLLYEGGKLTSIQIHRKTSEVVVYSSLDGYELEADTFVVDYENLYGEMEAGETNDLFVISAQSGNNLFSNIPKNKMYLYEQTIHFSIEDRKQGIVTHSSIDIGTKEQQTTVYQLPRFTEDESILEASSLVYEDLILLATYQKEGLKLEIHAFGEAGLTQTYDFPTDAEMDDYFLEANAERNNGTKLTDKQLLHPYLKRSLILSLEPTAEGDLWLIVGSIPQMSPAAQTALYFSVSVAAAFLGAAIDPNIGNVVAIDPAWALENGGNMLIFMADRYSKFVYRVGALNASDLSLKSKENLGIDESTSAEAPSLPETPYDKMLVFLAKDKDYRENAAAQIVFAHRDGIVKGYTTRKKEFRLYYFE